MGLQGSLSSPVCLLKSETSFVFILYTCVLCNSILYDNSTHFYSMSLSSQGHYALCTLCKIYLPLFGGHCVKWEGFGSRYLYEGAGAATKSMPSKVTEIQNKLAKKIIQLTDKLSMVIIVIHKLL